MTTMLFRPISSSLQPMVVTNIEIETQLLPSSTQNSTLKRKRETYLSLPPLEPQEHQVELDTSIKEQGQGTHVAGQQARLRKQEHSSQKEHNTEAASLYPSDVPSWERGRSPVRISVTAVLDRLKSDVYLMA